jgi:hypothetical protein
MGKKIGFVLVVLGAFLVTLALLSRFYAYDRLAVVPLDQDTVSVSEGPGARIFDIATQEEITLDLESVRTVVGDVEASEAASEDLDRQVAVWETAVVNDEPGAAVSEDNPPRSATHDRVAFDRHTGEAIDGCCETFLASAADLETGEEVRDTDTPITGQYFKLPFNTQQTTYQFWDGPLMDATDLEYQETEEIDGLTVYRFEQIIEPTDVGDIDAPASLFGIDAEGDVTLDRIYANTRTLWVEPETGVIIRGQEEQDVVAEYEGEEVATLTNVVIGYSEETIAQNVEDYSSLATQVKLIRVWVPLLGGILGGILLVIGAVLLLNARREPRAGHLD